MLFVMETWLEAGSDEAVCDDLTPCGDEAVCDDLTPSGYSIKSLPRVSGSGGGLPLSTETDTPPTSPSPPSYPSITLLLNCYRRH